MPIYMKVEKRKYFPLKLFGTLTKIYYINTNERVRYYDTRSDGELSGYDINRCI